MNFRNMPESERFRLMKPSDYLDEIDELERLTMNANETGSKLIEFPGGFDNEDNIPDIPNRPGDDLLSDRPIPFGPIPA